MDRLIIKQIIIDGKIDNYNYIIMDGYFLIYPEYLKDLKTIFNYSKDELIDILEVELSLKVLVLYSIDFSERVKSLMKYDTKLKPNLLKLITELKYVKEQHYTRAVWCRLTEISIKNL